MVGTYLPVFPGYLSRVTTRYHYFFYKLLSYMLFKNENAVIVGLFNDFADNHTTLLKIGVFKLNIKLIFLIWLVKILIGKFNSLFLR